MITHYNLSKVFYILLRMKRCLISLHELPEPEKKISYSNLMKHLNQWCANTNLTPS